LHFKIILNDFVFYKRVFNAEMRRLLSEALVPPLTCKMKPVAYFTIFLDDD